MKTVFIVNPNAGQGKDNEKYLRSIQEVSKKLKKEIEIYHTKSPQDASVFVKNYCARYGAARFLACGGDGTLSEVINGAITCEDAEVGVIPIGTGNDFCRNFPDADFMNLAAQLSGESVPCDVIEYKTEVNGVQRVGYCVNMFNIGFDCNVADKTASIKQKPFISGSVAYFLSILLNLIKKKGANLEIEIDGKSVHSGPLLLTALANGSYCGGGVNSNPMAQVDDGYINLNLVKNVSRRKFLSLLPFYMNGTYLARNGIEKIISTHQCRTVRIKPLTGNMRLCVDGEIEDAGITEFEILHHAIRFVVPNETGIVKEGHYETEYDESSQNRKNWYRRSVPRDHSIHA